VSLSERGGSLGIFFWPLFKDRDDAGVQDSVSGFALRLKLTDHSDIPTKIAILA
jgi:hypothetical protein